LLLISAEDIAENLSHAECIRVMREAMPRLSIGDTEQMLRQILPLDHGRMFGVMAGTTGAGSTFGSKLICVTPEGREDSVPSHQGVIIVFDPAKGTPACVADAGPITAIRTASASAMATDVLSRSDSRVLAVLGTGEQALHHALAIQQVRQLEEIRIWGRSLDRAGVLAAELSAMTGLSVEAVGAAREAVSGADVICTVTASAEPVLHANWVSPGTHINVVGSSYDGPREIDDALVAAARFYADSSVSVRAQGAEFRHALQVGVIEDDHLLGEIGEVLLGVVEGRQTKEEITIYKSLGHIVQDLTAVEFLHAKLRSEDT
jgi:ornithine cyclodeaminase/alanine dehydrogenase-like protein (mu-crystallin family)